MILWSYRHYQEYISEKLLNYFQNALQMLKILIYSEMLSYRETTLGPTIYGGPCFNKQTSIPWNCANVEWEMTVDLNWKFFCQPRESFWSVSMNSILQFLLDEMIKAFCFWTNIPLKCKINSLKLKGEIITVLISEDDQLLWIFSEEKFLI